MKTYFLVVISAIIGFSLVTPANACDQYPVAVLTIEPNYVIVNRPVLLDGSVSYDPDGGGVAGILRCEWDWTNDGTYDYAESPVVFTDGAFDRRAWHTYTTTGTVVVRLRVADSWGSASSITKTIVVSDDWDNDNLPDAWEVAKFGNTSSTNGVNNSDGDIYNDFCEYLHGSNPNSSSSQPSAGTITVPGDVLTIQAAINASIAGDIILVSPGSYNENLVIDKSNLTVTSITPDNWEITAKTVISASNTDQSAVSFGGSAAATTILKGFTITGGKAGIHCNSVSPTVSSCLVRSNGSLDGAGVVGGIYLESSSAAISNCFIVDNKAGNGGGMYNSNSSPTVTNCVFYNNTANNYGGAIYNSDSSLELRGCSVVKNEAKSGYGGGMYNNTPSGTPVISVVSSIVWGNIATYGNQIDNVNITPTITNCDIQGSGNDPEFANIDNPSGKDNILGTRDDGLRLRTDSPCLNMGSGGLVADILGQARVNVDIGAYELNRIRYVNKNAGGQNNGSSWANAYTNLQTALAAATAGDEIWVAKATSYTPGTTRASSFQLASNVSVYGGFAGSETDFADRNTVFNPTTLSGDIDGDNCYHVVKGANKALLDGFTITGGCANGDATADKFGGGIYLYTPYIMMSVRNCAIVNNFAAYSGGGIYVNSASNLLLANSVLTDNSCPSNGSFRGGAVYVRNSFAGIINCTVVANSASYGGGIASYENRGLSLIQNSILWGNTASSSGPNLYFSGMSSMIYSSDIQGCGGSANWNSAFGLNGGGNIASDPLFQSLSDPDGEDNTYGTFDDGLRLSVISPCMDVAGKAAAPILDILGTKRFDTIAQSDPLKYSEIGAYEWKDSTFPYITSFEKDQGFDTYTSIDNIDGWRVETGNADVQAGTGYYTESSETKSNPYQYVQVGNYSGDTTMSRRFEDFVNDNGIIRISCIPSPGLRIDIMSQLALVASIEFKDTEDKIWLLNSQSNQWSDTGMPYKTMAETYRDYVVNSTSEHLYDDSWLDLEVRINWANHTYNVYWLGQPLMQTAVPMNPACFNYTEIKFTTLPTANNPSFLLNRLLVSNNTDSGGVFGPEEDIYITSPLADGVLEGKIKVTGSVWFDKLGRYEVKCCPSDLEPTDANFMVVCIGRNPVSEGVLGYWDTDNFKNGTYYLKIEVFDDLGRKRPLDKNGIMKTTLTFNGTELEVNTQYAISGLLKGKLYSYTEQPDIDIPWPGQFPFNFQRTYSHGLRKHVLPLYYGWTHNHNIKVFEDTRFDWVKNVSGNPLSDPAGLGIAKIWLQEGAGCRMFIEDHIDTGNPNEPKVIYKPSDKECDYIVRISTDDSGNSEFDVAYTHYAADGTIMTFGTAIPYTELPENEGLVNWFANKGIDRKADRFGNALVYTWHSQDGFEMYQTSIESELGGNLTGTKITFENDLGGILYSAIKLQVNGNVRDMMHFTVTGGSQEVCYRALAPNRLPLSVLSGYYYNDKDQLVTISLPEIGGAASEPCCHQFWIHYNEDETILVKEEVLPNGGWYTNKEAYTYNCQPSGHLLTKTDYKTSYLYGLLPYKEVTYKSTEILQDRKGAILSENNRIFNDYGFNPYDYSGLQLDFFYWDSIHFDESQDVFPGGYVGGGGYKNVDYIYGDPRFAFKPTIIYEHFDDNADGTADGLGDRPTRKTTMSYDSRGNLIEQRVYVSLTEFVRTTYDYHQAYNFLVRKTTWQGCCTDSQLTVPGKKVCQEWLYGNADGTQSENGDTGNYLVRERTLLSESTQGDSWSETAYTYYTNGRVKTKSVKTNAAPETFAVDYFEYDSNWYPSKEWRGAQFDPQGNVIGNPQKRYCYDANGLLRLDGDYLGLVKMHNYDDFGCITSTRKYIDSDAMADTTDFTTERYDALLDSGDDYNYISVHRFEQYDYYNKCRWETLPTGGTIFRFYLSGELIVAWPDFYNNDAWTVCIPNIDHNPHVTGYEFNINPGLEWGCWYWQQCWSYYDSNKRLSNRYSQYSQYDLHPATVKHEQFNYNASGGKTSEKVYNVKCTTDEMTQITTFEPVLEKTAAYTYDILDRMTAQIEDVSDPQENPNGQNITARFGYDAVGNRIYVIDPQGNVLFTDYDNANRKIREYFAVPAAYVSYNANGSLNIVATKAYAARREWTEYYLDGKVKSKTQYDTNGTTILACSQYAYDARGRIQVVTQQKDASNNAVTQYDYSDTGFTRNVIPADPALYQICITDAELKQTWISLNYEGKPRKIVYPSGDYEEYIYYNRPYDPCHPDDPNRKMNGLLETKTVWAANGTPETITYEYDPFGKVSKIIYPDNEGYLTYEYINRFDNYGRVKKITDYRTDADRPGDYGSTYEFEYDFVSGNIRHYDQNDIAYDQNDFTMDYTWNQAYGGKTGVMVKNRAGTTLYDTRYAYDLAGRLVGADTNDFTINTLRPLAGFAYGDNGNRELLRYYLEGDAQGPVYDITYGYNADNMLTSIAAGVYPYGYTFNAAGAGNIDGLGRLKAAAETIVKPGTGTITHNYTYAYDMLSELTDSYATNVNGLNNYLIEQFTYKKDGNVETYQQDTGSLLQTNYSYFGDLMASATGNNPFTLTNDDNGNITRLPTTEPNAVAWNWDNKLANAQKGTSSIAVKYDPMSNRVYRQSTVGGVTTTRKYIVDISGGLPVILCEIDTSDGSLKKSYYYADGQILSMESHNPTQTDKYFYVHDRLGSIRLVIDSTSAVKNSYTYKPYGQFYDGECVETPGVNNPWKFTGQYCDEEIAQYYLRARQYDPAMMRFTSRDPVLGKQPEPLTLHQYLYCWNSPLKFTDPSGEYGITDGIMAGYEWHAAAIYVAATGVETGDWDLLMFGAFMETLIEPVMTLAMISSRNSDYGDSGGACFTEGTEVLTSQGEVPIENIRPTQCVWAADPDTGKPRLFEVVRCHKRKTNELVLITIGGEIIETTREHPFFVYEEGWRQADELKNGTKLIDFDGNPIEIEKIEIKSCQARVYNFEVAISHTYYVSKSKLLVHNGCGKKIGKRMPKSELNKIQGAIDQLDGISKAQRNGPGIEDVTKSTQRVKNMLNWIKNFEDTDMWYD